LTTALTAYLTVTKEATKATLTALTTIHVQRTLQINAATASKLGLACVRINC
jgi:hypothetical protein